MTEQVSTIDDDEEEGSGWGALDDLPGNPIMWVLIISELLVFGAFFLSFGVSRLLEPEVFAQSQSLLDGVWGGVNTIVLLTSGLLCALATQSVQVGNIKKTRALLAGAISLGAVFGIIKFIEYGDKFDQGIGIETDTFFTLFFLMTGFHFMHVIFGMILLSISMWKCRHDTVETVCSFWHMVDLIWVLLYPLVYLAR